MKKYILLLLALVLLFSFSSCTSTSSIASDGVEAESVYEIVGYRYVFDLSGNKIGVRYVDWYGDSELDAMAKAFLSYIPNGVSASVVAPGEIVVVSKKSITLEQFNGFVEQAESLIHSQIF